MKRTKIYLGYRGSDLIKPVLFKSSETPTAASHGDKYNAVIGPFRTKRGAEFMRDHGYGNPHIQTVADAERIAKRAI